MLYYVKGKEVVGDVTALTEAIPVHRKCIEWYEFMGIRFMPLDWVLVLDYYTNHTNPINIAHIGKNPEIEAFFPSLI